jgi:hypothetical protein
LENLNDSENIKENIRTSAKESQGLYELERLKPWFDEECLSILDPRKRLKCSGCKFQTKAM